MNWRNLDFVYLHFQAMEFDEILELVDFLVLNIQALGVTTMWYEVRINYMTFLIGLFTILYILLSII